MMSFTEMLFRFGLVLLVLLALDVATAKGLQRAFKRRSAGWRRRLWRSFWVCTLAYYLLVLVVAFKSSLASADSKLNITIAFSGLVLLYVPKLVYLPFVVVDVLAWLVRRLWLYRTPATKPTAQPAPQLAALSRSEFLHQLGLGLSALPLAATLYGLVKGGYDFRVIRHTLYLPNLPPAFDGLKLVQLSDIHVGSFSRQQAVADAIALANAEQPDYLVFTGDLVNNRASEMEPWLLLFQQLKAREKVFSIFGNHDYGDYTRWPSPEAKAADHAQMKSWHQQLGWDLLLDEHRLLHRGTDTIAVLGVQNWGDGGFPKYGDLDRALAGLPEVPFRLLLSHDPTHWDNIVQHHPSLIDLTLSGHTHGMQFGIETPHWRWSPAQYRYPHWAGLYQQGGRMLYVNRGFGFLGFPGRVGIWPEITSFILRRGSAALS